MTTNNILIYQIGRLDTNFQQPLDFEIKGETFESILSSFALKKHYNDYNVNIKLLFPISLPFNSSLYNSENFKKMCTKEFYEILYSAYNDADSFLNNPQLVFDKHPHLQDNINYMVIPSVGNYSGNNKQIYFSGHYSDIVLIILIDMIESFFKYKENVDKIIVDISSGHNYYVSAMIEALKHIDTWITLYKWNEKKTFCFIAVTEPIIPGFKGPYKISIEEQHTKVFFSCPISAKDIENTHLARTIFPEKEMRSKKRNLNEILEKFGLAFSAVKNNIPLFIYTNEFHNKEYLKDFLNEFLKYIKDVIYKDYLKTPNLNKNAYLKVFHSVAFYMALVEKFMNYGIDNRKEVETKNLCDNFRKIYSNYNLLLNDTILGNEVDRINGKILEDCSWTSLNKIFYENATNACSPQKRNFFAHAGLESNVTECCKNGSQIFVRYREDCLNTIKNWLIESI